MISKPEILQQKSLIAIVSSASAEQKIRRVAKNFPAIEVTMKSTNDPVRDAARHVNGSADVVMIEIDLDQRGAVEVLESLNSYISTNGALIVLAKNLSTLKTRQLFKMGVNDVLPLPLDLGELRMSMESAFGDAMAKQSQARPNGKIITMLKSGGGVGSTMLATNIAHTLMTRDLKTRKFLRSNPDPQMPRVAVFDFDVQFGTVAVGLNIMTSKDLAYLRTAKSRLDASLLSAVLKKHASGLNILPGSSDIVPLTAFDEAFFEQLLAIARGIFDYVFIDMASSWSDWTPAILKESDLILQVLTCSVENVNNTQKILTALDNLNIDRRRTHLLVNRITKGLTSADRLTQIKKITGRPITVVREDKKSHFTARERGVLLHEVPGSGNSLKSLRKCAAVVENFLRKDGGKTSERIETPIGNLQARPVEMRLQ